MTDEDEALAYEASRRVKDGWTRPGTVCFLEAASYLCRLKCPQSTDAPSTAHLPQQARSILLLRTVALFLIKWLVPGTVCRLQLVVLRQQLSVEMRFLSLAVAATLSRIAAASLQVVPGGTWTTVSESPLSQVERLG